MVVERRHFQCIAAETRYDTVNVTPAVQSRFFYFPRTFLLAHFVLKLKIIIQSLWKRGQSWDQQTLENILPLLTNLSHSTVKFLTLLSLAALFDQRRQFICTFLRMPSFPLLPSSLLPVNWMPPTTPPISPLS